MARTPRMAQIEAMLAEDPDDAFLRYGLGMEHASAGDDEAGDESSQLHLLPPKCPRTPTLTWNPPEL